MNEEVVTYFDGKDVLLCSTNNDFIYHAKTFYYDKGYFSLTNSKYFSCKQFIPKLVTSVFITKNIENCCELIAAPKDWLIKNNFTIYEKPEKKKRKITKNDE